MKRRTTTSASINAENSSSSTGSSNGQPTSLTGRPPFLSTSTTGTLGTRFHAASRIAHMQEGQPASASQSLSSALGLFPRAGASPVHSNRLRSWQPTTAASLAAPQPDKAGDTNVKIKTRDPTSASRRAVMKQSSGLGPHNRVDSMSELRRSNTLEATVQSLRSSAQHSDVHLLGSHATSTHLPSSHQCSSADAAASQPRTILSVASSQIPQQHLSPISEVTNASFSSASCPREIGYEGSSDDIGHDHDSALYTLSPMASRQEAQVHASRDKNQLVSLSVANLQLQPLSPVQREAPSIFDAQNGDTLIENMDDLIADSAPMQVHDLCLFFCL